MTKNRFTKQEVYDGINRYRINESNFIVEILDDGIPMHYSTIVNRLNEQDKTITRLEKENEQLKSENQSWLKTASHFDNVAHKDRDYAKRMHKENEQLKQFKEKVFVLLDEKIKHYEHKPFSAPVGQPMSVTFDADVDRLARLSELQDLEKELQE